MDTLGSRFAVLSLLALLVGTSALASAGRAQDPSPTPADGSTAPSQQAPVSPLEALRKAPAEELPKALRSFVEDQIASRAIFAGQFTALKEIPGCDKLLVDWIARPPQGVSRTAFRGACVRAVRDVFEKASEDLLAKLNKVAGASYEDGALRSEAGYALAQFGERKFVETLLAAIEKATQSEAAGQRAEAFQALAELRYNLREFAAAAAAYESLLALLDSGALPIEASARATMLYNTACSHSLAGDKDKAFGRLRSALETWKKAGEDQRRLLATDMDLRGLREDERFRALMAEFLPPTPKPVSEKGGPAKGEGAKEGASAR